MMTKNVDGQSTQLWVGLHGRLKLLLGSLNVERVICSWDWTWEKQVDDDGIVVLTSCGIVLNVVSSSI